MLVLLAVAWVALQLLVAVEFVAVALFVALIIAALVGPLVNVLHNVMPRGPAVALGLVAVVAPAVAVPCSARRTASRPERTAYGG